MNLSPLYWLGPVGAISALGAAFAFSRGVMANSEGEGEMVEIAQAVRDGAMAYLTRQYKVVALVFVALVAVLFVLSTQGTQAWQTAIGVPVAGLFSGLCGWFGMKMATNASARTAFAAKQSLNDGLKVAFRAGAVMGLVVVGFALLDISAWFFLYTQGIVPLPEGDALVGMTTIMLSYGMGASTQALFARVGGGIYTKAADVGADLVGKVEAGIPEDDARNPATIADNVGDNVGDVAGMGADLYESYYGSILATMAIGAAAALAGAGSLGEGVGLKLAIAPLALAGFGVLASLIGVFVVKAEENASFNKLLKSLHMGVWAASAIIVVASWFLLQNVFAGTEISSGGVWGAIVTGLLGGLVIAWFTEYYTSYEHKPTQSIAEQAQTGPATVIIAGISVGMISTWIPIAVVVVGIMLAFYLAGGGDNFLLGLYGVGIAAVGMLSTLGITLATDAYGPIADNAGGNAEMSGQPSFVRDRTDMLDSLGNTTAATGKGFAIGSAALTALALLASYVITVKEYAIKFGVFGEDATSASVSIQNVVDHYNVTLLNPSVLGGVFIGVMLAFVFCAMTMNAVGRAAYAMMNECRRQFVLMREAFKAQGMTEEQINDPMQWPKKVQHEGKQYPDYASCVAISTTGAQKEMVMPSILAIVVPILVGILLGVAGVLGMLVGGLTSGFAVAIYMANAGGAWDNAKKYIEKGHFGGKGSESHKAGVVGDTVGDPFKDTSGPALNILIKLIAIVSVVFAGVVVEHGDLVKQLLG
ncbi:MAG: sodium-translocating pyrophosphatase [Planctomycetota bacterium]|nr:sodium-translocating pyrophosphatase [Planctomycetota bacterium]MEC8412600.1 sodium-translocating pyrophosphatase [Planctomycetota bacterium]MEC8854407.1 sodium-translocating pyrophosphatase [Planctomycetota bacterium]